MDAMAEEGGGTITVPTVSAMLDVSARAQVFLEDISEEIDFATSTAMGERLVEVHGRQSTAQAAAKLEKIVLPDLRTAADYVVAACKHECAVLKQTRHIRQARAVWTKSSMV